MQRERVAHLRDKMRQSLIFSEGTDIVMATVSKSTPSQVIWVPGSAPLGMFSSSPNSRSRAWKRHLPGRASTGGWAAATSSM